MDQIASLQEVEIRPRMSGIVDEQLFKPGAMEAKVKQAELDLSYTEIKSPVDGQIGLQKI